MSKFVDVVACILIRDNGTILIAQRPEGKPYEGYWEFPGGKVEAGETLEAALKRELMEELGVSLLELIPWCGLTQSYPHLHVRLHCYICRKWQGDPIAKEHQVFCWQNPIIVSPLLPTVRPLVTWLSDYLVRTGCEIVDIPA